MTKQQVTKAVWDLSDQLFTEWQIICVLLVPLAEMVGNKRRLNDIPEDPTEAKRFLTMWFHGTITNYLIESKKMGAYVREKMLSDKPYNRLEIRTLANAKLQDLADGIWSEKTCGPHFNKVLESL